TIQYVMNQAGMDGTLTEQGLQRARLIVRDIEHADRDGVAPVARTFEGDELQRAVRVLRRLDELVEIAERRGVKFTDLLAARAGDPEAKRRLPTHRLTWTGGEAFAWSEQEARRIATRQGQRLADMPEDAGGNGHGAPANGAPAPAGAGESGPRVASLRELHENRELERLFEQLERVGLSIDDWSLTQERSASGEKMPTRFAWELTGEVRGGGKRETAEPAATTEAGAGGDEPETSDAARRVDQRVVEAANLSQVLPTLHEVGRRGLEITRFKGLGEMDAEQLWETTMDASKRTLLRVNWDVAGDADRLFSILMGEDVDQRRRYIEEHALEVKNLDV
ncbi:MAG: hypothetical protein JNJ48_01860, partial [Phycisphaerae bacterium]|nr:hypothetical protein [Phycisphaerae bacterium]